MKYVSRWDPDDIKFFSIPADFQPKRESSLLQGKSWLQVSSHGSSVPGSLCDMNKFSNLSGSI